MIIMMKIKKIKIIKIFYVVKLYMPLFLPPLLITSELIKNEIIHDTAKEIYGYVSDIYHHNEPELNIALEELDIVKKIELIEVIFTQYSSDSLGNDTQVLTLNNLHDISIKIKEELEEIKKDLKEYDKLYFKWFRSTPYLNKLKNLKRHCKILNERLDLFTKLVC